MNINDKLRIFIIAVPKVDKAIERSETELKVVRECGCVFTERLNYIKPTANEFDESELYRQQLTENKFSIDLCPKHNDKRLLDAKFCVGEKVRLNDNALAILKGNFNFSKDALRRKREGYYTVLSAEANPDCDHIVVTALHCAESEPEDIAQYNLEGVK